MNTARLIEMPPNRLTLPRRGEPSFPMRHAEWRRLRARVESLQHPIPGLRAAAWSVTGMAVSGLLAWVSWLVTEAQLSTADQEQFVILTPALLVFTAGTAFVAIALFVANRGITSHRRRSARDVLSEMDDIYRPYRDR